jgi:D-glycero-D-manno-heptose 1,7-bisphosphate phosphatase
MNSRPYVLLDRDGTIIVEKNYLASVDQLELLPGAAEGLRLLETAGYGLVVITNQSGVARGKLTIETLDTIHTELKRLLQAEGVTIGGIYYCPHGPQDGCECRKPKTLLARQAAADLGFDLSQSIAIGDKPSDIGLGRNCGAETVLVRTGYGRKNETRGVTADHVFDDLLAAARHIAARGTHGVG